MVGSFQKKIFVSTRCIPYSHKQLVTWSVTNWDVLLLATIRYMVSCPTWLKNLGQTLHCTHRAIRMCPQPLFLLAPIWSMDKKWQNVSRKLLLRAAADFGPEIFGVNWTLLLASILCTYYTLPSNCFKYLASYHRQTATFIRFVQHSANLPYSYLMFLPHD